MHGPLREGLSDLRRWKRMTALRLVCMLLVFGCGSTTALQRIPVLQPATFRCAEAQSGCPLVRRFRVEIPAAVHAAARPVAADS